MGLLGINIDYVKAGGHGFLRETRSADGGSGIQQLVTISDRCDLGPLTLHVSEDNFLFSCTLS